MSVETNEKKIIIETKIHITFLSIHIVHESLP
jgi:hypothetical protein